MPRAKHWAAVEKEVRGCGLSSSSEVGRLIIDWIGRELDVAPVLGWETKLPDSVRRLIDLHQGFMEEYQACFLVEDAPGERWVQSDLRSHFGFASAQMAEAVLERIRDLRLHLLQSFRDKHLPSAFGDGVFHRPGVRGYFRQVSWVESRKAPFANELLNTDGADIDWQPDLSADEEDDFPCRVQMLADFWQQLRFSREMRLEGLVSLGLGHLTGESVLEQRCRDYLSERLPAWEQQREQLQAGLSKFLYRLGKAEAQIPLLPPGPEKDAAKEEVAERHAQLRRRRERLLRHADHLFPPPRDMRALLEGFVTASLGSIRFRRIGVEIQLFRERVEARMARMCAETSGDLAPFAQRVQKHLSSQPANPRQQGLDEESRQQRETEMRGWLAEGLEIVKQARALQVIHMRDREGQVNAMWMNDIRDLYECGILERTGVVGGLRRQGWRLEAMLRTD